MRILICGVSGMIGHTLWRAVAGRHEDVFGTLHGRRDVFARHALFDERSSNNSKRPTSKASAQYWIACDRRHRQLHWNHEAQSGGR